MNRLYQKSEIWFAVLWIVVYVLGGSIADAVSEKIGIEKSVTLIFFMILCVAAWKWLRTYDQFEKYGLCRPKAAASRFLYYIPLFVLVSVNFWFGTAWNLSVPETLLYIGSMLCVGFLEELIFRGFLFKAMSKDGITSAIIVSSVTFGIGHIVNLVNGSGADLLSNLCQVCYAMAAGFLFVILFYRGGSLVPCILTHSILNACSVFANEKNVTAEREIFTAVILTVISIGYAMILLKTLPGKDSHVRNKGFEH